ncbi:MAG: hypothetical protein Q7S53_03600 [bacterium]|nr:hypothetical protein [bacterium]
MTTRMTRIKKVANRDEMFWPLFELGRDIKRNWLPIAIFCIALMLLIISSQG